MLIVRCFRSAFEGNNPMIITLQQGEGESDLSEGL